MIPRKAKRDANEQEIVQALRKAGASVYLLDQPCDALVGFRNRTYLAEFKGRKGKLTASQAKFADEWRGQVPEILRSVDDALDWINSPARRGL